ncbi:hypothetical protein DSECCO2_581450 [anaerobic digester metagenome]
MELATVSAIILGSAAVVGLFLTTIQLRQLAAQRRTDMLIRLSPYFSIGFSEWQTMSSTVLSSEFKDYDEFVNKYGPMVIDKPLQTAIATVSNYYEGIGILLKRGLVEQELIHDLYGGTIISTWEKLYPLAVELRKRSPGSWENFERLYAAMKEIDSRTDRT